VSADRKCGRETGCSERSPHRVWQRMIGRLCVRRSTSWNPASRYMLGTPVYASLLSTRPARGSTGYPSTILAPRSTANRTAALSSSCATPRRASGSAACWAPRHARAAHGRSGARTCTSSPRMRRSRRTTATGRTSVPASAVGRRTWSALCPPGVRYAARAPAERCSSDGSSGRTISNVSRTRPARRWSLFGATYGTSPADDRNACWSRLCDEELLPSRP
jgi:hypothetical protein